MEKLVSLKSARARKARAELISEMGGACQFCGTPQSLEFDVHPMADTSHHFFDSARRMRFYWQMKLIGNLRLLCRKCHLSETAKMNSKFHGVTPRFRKILIYVGPDSFCWCASISETTQSVSDALFEVQFYAGDGI
jgi:5-methylcytosine-specific restriction endonuclease McrA